MPPPLKTKKWRQSENQIEIGRVYVGFYCCLMSLHVLWKQLSNIARSQRQIMLQLDNLSTLLRERSGPRSQHQPKTSRHRLMAAARDPVKLSVSAISALAVAGLGILVFRGLRHRNWTYTSDLFTNVVLTQILFLLYSSTAIFIEHQIFSWCILPFSFGKEHH